MSFRLRDFVGPDQSSDLLKPLDVLREKWTVATAGPALFTYPAAKPAAQIDYVLCRPGKRFRVVESKVIDEALASDHRPVVAVVELVP